MRTCRCKIAACAIGLLLPAILVSTHIPVPAAAAPVDANRWTKVGIPTEGEAGNWVLAAGSDVHHPVLSPDGTLYACCPGLPYTLYRSTDGGRGWTHIGNVHDTIVSIAVAPHDASRLYYATNSTVYRSSNGGRTFEALPPNPGGAGTGTVAITAIAVSRFDSTIVAAATRDAVTSAFGGVYTLDEADVIPTWTDTGIGSYDVYAVAFSPCYASDRQLMAVMTDETDTCIAVKTGGGWGAATGTARLDRDNSGSATPVAVAVSAAIAFPDDYDSGAGNDVFFVAIDTGDGGGDVYRFDAAEAPSASIATDLDAGSACGEENIDITGLAVRGDSAGARLLAGAADSAMVLSSVDAGDTWTTSRKEPTGNDSTFVLMPAGDGAFPAFSATSGDGSAFSVSTDNGTTWNQCSLIDTSIDAIVDVAPSPGYDGDTTLFMITFGNGHSLWRTTDGGATWERVLTGAMDDGDVLSRIGLPPCYGDGCRTVFAAGECGAQPSIWESTDNGHSFRRRFTRDPDSGAPFSVDTWAIADESTLFIGSYNDSNGTVYKTTSSGFIFTPAVMAGGQSLHDLVLSPDYEEDATILAGNTYGWVYLSDDGGESFRPLPPDAVTQPLTGLITVAFDPGYKDNRTVYAASHDADCGIYRFFVGGKTGWESIDASLPDDARINRVVVTGDGSLYAADTCTDSGMERSLDPACQTGPTFGSVSRGLGEGAVLVGLWHCGHRLWSVDAVHTMLMTYSDILTAPVTLRSPGSDETGIGNLAAHAITGISLDWDTLDGATGYQWQCDSDTDFSTVPDDYEATTGASTAILPDLLPGTTYYWRVRASAPAFSPWSAVQSFTTSLDTGYTFLALDSPAAGAEEVNCRPVFQWTPIAGADAYELLVSSDAGFTQPVLVREGDYALPGNAWQCDVCLDYGATYYWKVRAVCDTTCSAWSAAGAFTTASSPEEPAPGLPGMTDRQSSRMEQGPVLLSPLPANSSPMQLLPPSPTPPPQETVTIPLETSSSDIPVWVICLIGCLLVIVILALLIALTMTLKMKRQ